jgi:cytoskeleton protein RodZ
MDYSELGAYLKEEREKQGFSLEDIQQKTKISISSLEAIEEGRVNELPHPVYTKGFIKNYAQCLGLNADEVAGTFAQKAGIDEEFEDEADHVPNELSPIRKKSKWPLFSILVSLVLLAVLGWLVYDLFLAPPEINTSSQSTQSSESVDALENEDGGEKRQGSESNEPDLGDTAGREDSNLGQGTEDKEMSSEQESGGSWTSGPVAGNETLAETQTSQVLAEAEQNNAVQERVGEEQENETGTAGGNQEEQIDSPTNAEQIDTQRVSPPENGKHVLQIEATEACWMSADIDSKRRDLYLRPGESATFRFEDSLEIKLGNAGGVELIFNGQAYPLDAASGDVVSLSFP